MKRFLFWCSIPVSAAIVLHLWSGFNGLYGQDAFEYARFTKALINWYEGGSFPGDFFWPLGYPLVGSVLGITGIPAELSLQLVSLLSLGAICWFTERVLADLSGKTAGVRSFVLCSLLLSPFLFRGSLLCMSDVLSIAAISGHFYFLMRWIKTRNGSMLIGIAVCAAVAVMTRYVMVLFFVPTFFFIVPSLMDRRLIFWIVTAGVSAVMILLPHGLLRSGSPAAFLQHEWLSNWSFANYFIKEFSVTEGSLNYALPNALNSLLHVVHPGYFSPAIFLIMMGWKKIRKDEMCRVAGAATILYLLFISGIPYQNDRFFLPLIPLLVIIALPGWTTVRERFGEKAIRMALAAWILLDIVLIGVSLKKYPERNQLEQQIAQWVRSHAEGRDIYSFDVTQALLYYNEKGFYHDLWTTTYTTWKQGDVIIYHPERFKTQWKNKNPELNWEFVKKNYQLRRIGSFDDGWCAWEIAGRQNISVSP